MMLARLGQVEHARVRTHEHVGGMKRALEESVARLRYVNAAERRLEKRANSQRGLRTRFYKATNERRLETYFG